MHQFIDTRILHKTRLVEANTILVISIQMNSLKLKRNNEFVKRADGVH